MKPSGIAIVLASLAAVIQTFAPLWLFIGLILGSMLSTMIGLWQARREYRRQQLLDAMERAFGESHQT